MTDKTFTEKIATVQNALIVPKTQNAQVPYKSRNAEEILDTAKPLLLEQSLIITICDAVIEIGGRIFIKSIATITDGDDAISGTGIAELLPGNNMMNVAQASGATGSYARKYALGAVLAIGDGEDADHAKYQPSEHDSYTPKVASAKQIGFADSLLAKADKDAARTWFKNKFGDKKLAELTSKECSDFIEYLQNKPAGTVDDISEYSDAPFDDEELF